MADKKVKCITCEKEVLKSEALTEFGVYFCSEKCLEDYKEHLSKIDKEIKLDDCC